RAQAPVARAHHYVPGFYLAGFTPSGRRDDFLWVHDRQEGRQFRARPDATGFENDFYRVDLDGLPPDAVERDVLARFDDEGADVLARIARDRALPTGKELEALVRFIAISIVRTPGFRKFFLRSKEEMARFHLRFTLAHPQAYEAFKKDMEREGKPIREEMNRETLLAFIDEPSRYQIVFDPIVAIRNLLEMHEALFPVIAARTWSLFEAGEDDFIASDNPVSVVATSPDAGPFFGFGVKETEITFPLSRSLALVGSFHDQGVVSRIERKLVGLLNRRTLDSAQRFVYSSGPRYLVSASNHD
ncbi:MAG: DUF4238 domain-containing protein, partial [Thermoanaerobaculia bacterium]|nr:DUF4238 domain-containing protein [Thermoanaerobaculia bacterium]